MYVIGKIHARGILIMAVLVTPTRFALSRCTSSTEKEFPTRTAAGCTSTPG